MKDLKVAILGATPDHVGYYHAREFKNAGADVIAILRSSEDGANYSARSLEEEFGIMARPYWNLERLLEETKPDAVAVCTPTYKHHEHTKLAILSGAHVLCEKPVYWDRSKTPEENLALAKELFELATQNRTFFTANTQLVYLFDEYLKEYRRAKSNGRKFQFELVTAGKDTGIDIPIDLLPHALSFLLRIDKKGDIKEIDGNYSAHETNLRLNYESSEKISVSVKLGKQVLKKMSFGFEDSFVTRETERYSNNRSESIYSLFNGKTGKRTYVEDALRVSVSHFVNAVKNRYTRALLVSPEEAFRNMQLQSKIISYLLYTAQN